MYNLKMYYKSPGCPAYRLVHETVIADNMLYSDAVQILAILESREESKTPTPPPSPVDVPSCSCRNCTEYRKRKTDRRG